MPTRKPMTSRSGASASAENATTRRHPPAPARAARQPIATCPMLATLQPALRRGPRALDQELVIADRGLVFHLAATLDPIAEIIERPSALARVVDLVQRAEHAEAALAQRRLEVEVDAADRFGCHVADADRHDLAGDAIDPFDRV